MLKQSYFVAVGLICALAGVVGCAKQEFKPAAFTKNAAAVGSRFLPAKVDILLVVDNTPSAAASVIQIQNQLSGFLSDMNGKFWDYHIAKMPLSIQSSYSPINHILVNANFNSTSLPDGTPTPSTGIVPSSFATSDPVNFMQMPSTTTDPAGDTVYQQIYNTLAHSNDNGTNFLRNDAMLAILVVTNGFEKTIWSYQNGSTVGSYNPSGDTLQQAWAQNLINLKGSRQLLRFYALASLGDVKNYSCQGSNAYPGMSYLDMINKGYLVGSAGNFCDSSSLSNILADIDSNLQITRQDYVYSAIVLDSEPRPESIAITKGDGNAIPQSSTDGWQYLGFGTAYTITGIYDPSTGNTTTLSPGLSQRTGYVIQLNGKGRIVGSDAPTIEFQKR